LATVLSIVMVLTMFPVTVLAAKEPDWQPSYLSDVERGIYDAIAGEVEERAVTGGEMIFTMSLENLSFDNQGESDSTKLQERALSFYQEQVHSDKILTCLVSDYPYEMFWYDKMNLEALQIGIQISTSGNITTINLVSYFIPVYQTYQDENAGENKQYTLSASQAQRAAEAAAYAQQIVDDNAGKSDQEKLEAYKDIICDLVSYDQETAEIIGNPDDPLYSTWYGDPYQIIHVFDGDPNTNVVEEGYAKAFQYLCDLSDFENAQCYYVVGDIKINSELSVTASPFNIVKLDGRNYLADVTLSDTGKVGESGGLFMATPKESGSIQDGYHFTVAGSDVHYTYASQYRTGGFFPESVLDLVNQYITGSVTVTGTPKIGETLTAEVEGIPSDAELSYQWYRGSSKIDGATDFTYTPMSEEDIGKRIKVVVSADGYMGTLEGRASSSVEKADTVNPVDEILILQITSSSITVKTQEGMEYACKKPGEILYSTDFQDSGTFTGLEPNTQYSIHCRVKETPTHNASPVNTFLVTTGKEAGTVIEEAYASLPSPKKNQPISDVSVTTANIAASVQWYEGSDNSGNPVAVGTLAKPSQVYTAYVTLTPNEGYEFIQETKFNVTSSNIGDYGMDSSSTLTNVILKITFKPTAAKALSEIMVTTPPAKTDYYVGDTFDPTGMVVKAVYDDGTSEEVVDYTYNPATITADTSAITISYGGKTAEVPITLITLDRIEITTQPSKTEYVEGQMFDPTGMVVTAYYSDGFSKAVTGYTWDPETITADTTAVTISYNGKTAQVMVSVQKKELESITITKQPDKIVYYDGDKFDPTGMEIIAWYNDGLGVLVPLEECIFTPDPLTEGTPEVTVSYEGKTAAVPVTVRPPRTLTEIKITTPPAKTEYYVGESFDPTGMVVTAYYNDDSSETVDLADCTFTPEEMTLGTTSVIVSYGGMTAVVNVTVSLKPVTNVDMSLTAPMQNVILDQSIAWNPQGLPEGIADAEVAWYKGENAEGELVSGKAEFAQIYTVRITLTASETYEFLTDFAATLNGETATVAIAPDGRTVVITKTFPPAVELPEGNIPISDEYFPDPVFQKYVSDNFDTDNSGYMTEAERNAVKEINVNASAVTDLTGIELFLNLEKLACDNIRLETLDVSNNTKLTHLECTGIDVSTLDLSHNPELILLDCQFSGNLTTLNVSGCTKLVELNCSFTALTELDISDCTDLERLHCMGSQLMSLDTSYCTELTVLQCLDNNLPELDVSKNTKLEELYCYTNHLKELDLSKNTSLKNALCDPQYPTEEVPEQPGGGWNLDLADLVTDGSRIEKVVCEADGVTIDGTTVSWDKVYLSFVVTYYYDTGIDSIQMILTLYPQHAINEENFPDAAFRQYVSDHIDQNGDGILTKSELEAVTEIDVEGGYNGVKIADLTGIEYFPNLTKLNCNGNTLTKLDVSANTKLEELSCPNQKLTVDIAPMTDQKWNFDLSTFIDDWSKVSNVRVQNATLENDGKTVSWKNGAENPTVQYDYRVDDNDTIMAVTLILNYTPNTPSDILPYIPSVTDGWKQNQTGSWHYYQDGEAVTGWLKKGELWYYLDPETGIMADGWQYINGVWYYLKPVSGNMMTGWQYINGVWYYFKDWGGMATGWQYINGVWYYLKDWGGMATGWQYINGVWYYLKDWGGMATGWQYINSAWYYLKDWGGMAYNTTIDGYYLGADGAIR
ncbi:MAG: bacterial Ig-like domain-containing protein, partial [Candidatus Merdivicinus sp.]|jgi:glucan-binding YG repeat protein